MKIFTTKTVQQIVSKHCTETKKIKDFTSHYLYVVSNIYMRPYTDKRYSENDYVPLNMNLLEELISKREAKNVVANLIKLEIIETDNKVIRGVKSKGYRLVSRFSDVWFLTPITDLKLAEKLHNKNDIHNCDVNKRGGGYKVVNFWFNELELDYSKAKKYIDNHYRKDYLTSLQYINTHQTEKETTEFKKHFSIVSIYESNLSNITMFKDNEKFICVDNKSNRLHCNLTNISTPLRQFLSLGGDKLWNVDIANSQPTFLGLLMRRRDTIDKEEVERYLEVCKSGQFYEYISELGGLDLDLTDYKIRKKFKQSIFSGVLFDRNRKDLSKWEKTFQSVFPSIFKEVREIKKKDYNAMAIMLQKEESSFIFGCIQKLYSIFKYNIVLLSIHDSIVSTKDGVVKVKDIMEEEFSRKYKFIPNLKYTKI